MKKIVLLALLAAVGVPVVAQPHEGGAPQKERKEITELVNDLSKSQKSKIESISKESAGRVSEMRLQQKMVRDSIRFYMDMEGDQSAVLYPLFDREARLQVAISREMYSGKCRIDEVLSREQRAELRKACSKKRPRKESR